MDSVATAPATDTRYRVTGMDCAACATKIDRALRRIPGIEDVSVSATTGNMTVRHGGDAVLPQIEQCVASLGYGVSRAGHDQASSSDSHASHLASSHEAWWKSPKAKLVACLGIGLLVAEGVSRLAPDWNEIPFAVAMLIGLVPIGKRAISAARAGSPFSIEMLMTVAAVGALAIGATQEAAVVVFLFLIGELLEGVAAGRARSSIQALALLIPKTALLEVDGQTREIPADDLAVGSVIVVRPGDRIPADGTIISGDSEIDESPVTGESVPVRKGPDASVFAGTVNGGAVLRIKVGAPASDNTIARIIRLVEQAQESKAPTERFIDRFSRYYTPLVLVVATLVAVIPPLAMDAEWSTWIYRGLAILLIGCPCALVISTPAAIAAGLSAGARRGLLMKGGAVLENFRHITMIAFDKTGTLTEGKPKVTDIVSFDQPAGEVLRIAGGLESGSSHPLAKAILDKAKEEGLSLPQVTDARAIGGKGVSGTVDRKPAFLGSPNAVAGRATLSPEQAATIQALQDDGNSVTVVLLGSTLVGAIAMRDEPRPDAQRTLSRLSSAGIKTVMLTGDNKRAASAIGQRLGIDVRAELLPEDKQRLVGEFKGQGQVVAKVGDGINDAPALAAADLGVAMGGGTDVALETADAASLHGRVADIFDMIHLSKTTMRNIHQNIAIALGLKAVFLVTTVVGLTGLWPAILADTGATVLVTINALRLLNSRSSAGA